jgi:hypothetical protein
VMKRALRNGGSATRARFESNGNVEPASGHLTDARCDDTGRLISGSTDCSLVRVAGQETEWKFGQEMFVE